MTIVELESGYFQHDTYSNSLIIKLLAVEFDATDHQPNPIKLFLFIHLKKMQTAIIEKIWNIIPQMLINVSDNFNRRINLCVENDGTQFELSS